MRIHITGASGSGTTTLGRVLGQRLNVPHLDSDSFFWSRRIRRLRRLVLCQTGWLWFRLQWMEFRMGVFWISPEMGAPLEPLYDLIVFLRLDPVIRMNRIRLREKERYGARIQPVAICSRQVRNSSTGQPVMTRRVLSNAVWRRMRRGFRHKRRRFCDG